MPENHGGLLKRIGCQTEKATLGVIHKRRRSLDREHGNVYEYHVVYVCVCVCV